MQVEPCKAGSKVACVRCGQRLQIPERPAVNRNRTVLGTPAPDLSITSGLSPNRPREQDVLRPPVSAPVATVVRCWYSCHRGQQQGPYSEPAMQRRAAEGDLGLKDPVWTEGMQGWEPAHHHFQFPSSVLRPTLPHSEAEVSPAGRVCGILSIIFGSVGFLLCPWVFSLAGLVLGIFSLSTCSHKKLGTIGTVLSAVSLLLGLAWWAMLLNTASHSRYRY
jgi:hypothetical protein